MLWLRPQMWVRIRLRVSFSTLPVMLEAWADGSVGLSCSLAWQVTQGEQYMLVMADEGQRDAWERSILRIQQGIDGDD